MDALELLTEDCWIEILKRVKDPKDLKSCSEACLIFEEILRRKRNEFMFSLVLPMVLDYLPADFNRGQWITKLHQNIAILKCRLVCKSWCESVDKFRNAEHEDKFERLFWFSNGETTERFLQKFANHAGNPFMGTTVTLQHRYRSPLLLAGNQDEGINPDEGRHPDEDPQIREEDMFHVRMLPQLLARFGTQILRVVLFNSSTHEDLTFCKNMRTILGYLTNLRSLRLRFGYSYGFVEEDQREDIPELTAYIAANPLPDLPQLENLEATGINEPMLLRLLERYAPQLKTLAVGNLKGFEEHGVQMANLEELSLKHLDASTPLLGLGQLQALQLRSLMVTVSYNRNSVDRWPIDELFRNIQHLPIQRLAIRSGVPVRESGPISTEQRPSHGSISSIDLLLYRHVSFNFLLYCPELTSIRLLCVPPRQGEEIPQDGIVELLDLTELMQQDGYDLYRSNIWEIIPSLESFNNWGRGGPDDDCARDEYEKRKLGNGEELVGQD